MNLSAAALIKAVNTHGGFEPRSCDLIKHGDLKWKQFAKHIDWKGKTVVDIGCHVGLVAMRAAAQGAKSVTGCDLRKDVIDFNNTFCKKHRIGNATFFNWGLSAAGPVFDIVLCLGVINKFPDGEYQKMIAKLCFMAKYTLVLETCFNNGISTGYTASVRPPGAEFKYHTRPSAHYLLGLLRDNGFTVTKRIKSVAFAAKDFRETWIAERTAP